MRAWLCNAPGLDGTLCIDSPRCPAATQCPRLHALYGGPRHTGRARRLAGGDEARGRPDPCASHAGRRAVARDSTDTRDGRWRPTGRSRPVPRRCCMNKFWPATIPHPRALTDRWRTSLAFPGRWRRSSDSRRCTDRWRRVLRLPAPLATCPAGLRARSAPPKIDLYRKKAFSTRAC